MKTNPGWISRAIADEISTARRSPVSSSCCTAAPNSIFSCSASFTPACLRHVCRARWASPIWHRVVRSKSGPVAGRSLDGVEHAAALSGHVRSIQHGCHRSVPGVCSRWLMVSHWSSPETPGADRPIKQAQIWTTYLTMDFFYFLAVTLVRRWSKQTLLEL